MGLLPKILHSVLALLDGLADLLVGVLNYFVQDGIAEEEGPEISRGVRCLGLLGDLLSFSQRSSHI